MELEKEFTLPSSLEDKYPDKTGVEIIYHDFAFNEDMINVDYIYKLNKFQLYFCLSEIASLFGIKSEGDKMYKFLLDLLDEDEGKLYYLIQDYLDYKAPGELRDKLKDFAREKAFEEFKDAFRYWVDDEDMDAYFKKEEFDS